MLLVPGPSPSDFFLAPVVRSTVLLKQFPHLSLDNFFFDMSLEPTCQDPTWCADESTLHDDNRVSIYILYGGTRIIADLSPSDSGAGLEDQLIKEYKEAYDAEDEQQTTIVQDKIAHQIVQLGKHKACVTPASDVQCFLVTIEGTSQVLEQHDPCPVGSVSAVEGSYQDLENNDFQETGSIEESQNSDECLPDTGEYDDYYYDGIPASSLRNTDQAQSLARYSTKSIQVLEKLEAYGGGFIVRALVEGRERCVKVFDDLSYHAVQREFDCLCKVAKSRYTTTLRTPKLIGLVESADGGRQIGIVEEYISHAETYEMSNLAHIGDVALHEIGVVWGDAKPNNVLIDSETDDIYIIDFGGGYTDGWGAERTMNTIEGDVQVLKKIDDYLQIQLT
ncbi:hypothetical protein K449DRAFT_467602 [Hypoxylon sp. EC38]|nr:hypothetical protein K449DRAFT_467602 [Hypoxylon sp. EC38]